LIVISYPVLEFKIMLEEKRLLKEAKKYLDQAGLTSFEVLEFLGGGEFGKVFKAKNTQDLAGLFYAIKIIKRILKSDEPSIQEASFIKKYYKLIKECCPGCVTNIYPSYIREWTVETYDTFETLKNYNLIIVSDYLPFTLKEMFNLPENLILEIILKLGECLKNFLSVGLIYTDLKPENVGLTKTSIDPIVLDFGGFLSIDKPRTLIEATITSKSLENFQYTFWFSSPEIASLWQKNKFERKDFFFIELKDGKSQVYSLAAVAVDLLLGGIKNRSKISPLEATARLEKPFRILFEKALVDDRYKRISLVEFLEELKNLLYGRGNIPEPPEPPEPPKASDETSAEDREKNPRKLRDIRVRKGEKLVLENNTFDVEGDIKVEPGGELVIKNAVLRFSQNAGIIGRDCAFIAESSTFKPLEQNWKNISLGGKIQGYIKECQFIGGLGRNSEEINQFYELSLKSVLGGALFVYCENGKYSILDCKFINCTSAEGGGIWALQNILIKNCQFLDCKALFGGGVFVYSQNLIRNCRFENCYAKEFGGGVLSLVNNEIKNNIFINCKATVGGGIYCEESRNDLSHNQFINCSNGNYFGCQHKEKGD
jgi:serine/threonine protein kinase